MGPIDDIILTAILFIPVIGLVVVIHELGHFWAGRWLGAKVEAFSVGFGHELWHRIDKHGTRWRVAALPLGGYVKFAGDADEASDMDAKFSRRPVGHYQSLPVWRRVVITAAGPFANFVLAMIVFTILFWSYGDQRLDPVIAQVVPDSPASEAGFEPGDRVLALNDRPVEDFRQIIKAVQAEPLRDFAFLIERGGFERTLTLRPVEVIDDDGLGRQARYWRLGLAANPSGGMVTVDYNLPGAAGHALAEMWHMTEATGRYIGRIVTFQESPSKIGGPIQMADVTKRVAETTFTNVDGGLGAKLLRTLESLFYLAGGVSLAIGLVNLLPIPILDGGRIVMHGLEAVWGRAVSLRYEGAAMAVSFILVLAIGVLVMINDVVKIVTGVS